ncbi:unnamed protein product [Adineta steineri]|uniref:Uncharacterized protein n=1 Tax=Adineta steineri TaxID=433720 RepID=A0A814BM25_9BILA|nr:unnamed protein product [Adineta steineri]CAF0928004.1 unnamed protein product [Adineta steineri]
MSCLLFFNFILLFLSISLFVLGITTSRWLVLIDDDNINNITSERSNGIITSCQRLYRQNNLDQYSYVYNITSSSRMNYNIYDDAYVCFNRLFKWHNESINGPDLLEYQKVIIGVSFSCIFIGVIALLFTQTINTHGSFHNIRFSKCMIDCLLITTILTVVLALITVALFLGFERLQTITVYGYSFWSFVAGTCCVFVSCILTAVYRIDVEFEFRRYRHESVATLC